MSIAGYFSLCASKINMIPNRDCILNSTFLSSIKLLFLLNILEEKKIFHTFVAANII